MSGSYRGTNSADPQHSLCSACKSHHCKLAEINRSLFVVCTEMKIIPSKIILK